MLVHYRNPVYAGYFADPFVLRHAGVYYAYGTAERAEPDGRRFPLLASDNLAEWRYLGGALTPPAEGQEGLTAYWAPEVAERDGRFFMYYSAGLAGRDETHRLRIAVADSPQGPFRDAGRFRVEGVFRDAFMIDASPFRDPADGAWYLFFATDFFEGERVGTGIVAAPLADDMLSMSGEAVTILRARSDWQIYERNRFHYGRTWDAWHTVEGPFVWMHGGAYYCFYSGGNWRGSDYGVGYALADHPLGPYRDDWNAHGPAVLRGIEDQTLGPGHASITRGPDGASEYLIYHAWDPALTARRMCIDPLLWRRQVNGPDRPRCAGPSLTGSVRVGG